MTSPENNQLAVYSIREYRKGNEIKNHWMRLGQAFINKDGSLNVYLNAVPATNDGTIKLHIRKPFQDQAEAADAKIPDEVGENFYDLETGVGL